MPNDSPDLMQGETLSPEQKLQKNLEDITREISQLNDTDDGSNDTVELVDGMLSSAFADYLKGIEPNVLNNLWTNVDNCARYSNDANLKKLQQFLAPIANPVSIDDSNLTATGVRGDYEDYDGKIGRIDNLDTTKAGLKSDIEGIISRLNGGDEKLAGTLSKILKVVENPNEADVKSLQKFLYNRLKGENRDTFLKFNFKNGSDGNKSVDNPDGMFGQNLVNGIRSFLTDLESYVSQVEASRNIQNDEDEFVVEEPVVEEEGRTAVVVDEDGGSVAAETKEQGEFNKSFGEIVNNEKWDEIKKLGDYSDISKQINKVLEIENSKDLLKENKNLLDKIKEIEGKLKVDEADLGRLKRDYELARDGGNSRGNLDWLRSNISSLKDKISDQKREIRRSNRTIENNKYTLLVEGSKNQRLANGLIRLESKLKQKYIKLKEEKQKVEKNYRNSLENENIAGLSEGTKSEMRANNARKTEDWNGKKDIFDKQLNAILEFGSWKIDDNGSIVDESDGDKLSDYRKYVQRINKLLSEELSDVSAASSDVSAASSDVSAASSDVSAASSDVSAASSDVDEELSVIDINNLNSSLKGALNGIISEEELDKLQINMEMGEFGTEYILTDGNFNIQLDGILSDETFCGKSNLNEKLKIVFEALRIYSQGYSNIQLMPQGDSDFSMYCSYENGEGVSVQGVDLNKYGITRDNIDDFIQFYNDEKLVSQVIDV